MTIQLSSLASAVILLGLAGCDWIGQRTLPPSEVSLHNAQAKDLAYPVGRYVLAGKREFPNGTEIYVLDTRSGQVCYYFVASGVTTSKNALESDLRACAGPALNPLAE